MKKGAYDIGRKVIYYFIVVLVLGFLLLYTDNVFGRYQSETEINTDSISDMIKIFHATNCLSMKEDTRTYFGVLDENQARLFQECMDDPNIVLILKESPSYNLISVEGYDTYTKVMLNEDKLEVIKLRFKR